MGIIIQEQDDSVKTIYSISVPRTPSVYSVKRLRDFLYENYCSDKKILKKYLLGMFDAMNPLAQHDGFLNIIYAVLKHMPVQLTCRKLAEIESKVKEIEEILNSKILLKEKILELDKEGLLGYGRTVLIGEPLFEYGGWSWYRKKRTIVQCGLLATSYIKTKKTKQQTIRHITIYLSWGCHA